MPPAVSGRGRRFCAASIAVLLAAFSATESRAATYYWDADAAGSAATGGTGNWDVASSLWRSVSDTGALTTWTNVGNNNDAFLVGTAGTLTLTTGISVNDISVAPTSGTAYIIAGATQTLTLSGAAQSVLDVASGSTLTISSGLAGTNGFTKSSAGTLILDSAPGTVTLFGSIAVNGGTLQAGTATNNGASQVLRSNAVNLAEGTSLTTLGTADLRVGSLSGSGSVTPASGRAINELALADATFSGTITTTGGLNLRGANATQTFSGTVSSLTGAIGINGVSLGSGSTSTVLKLSGSGALTGTGTTLELRGGALTLDNTGGNTGVGSTTDRLLNGGAISAFGGTLSLLGNATNGSLETVGAFTLNAGAATISVTHNGGSGGTALTLASFARTAGVGASLNFVGSGGTLGTADANPRIIFTSAPGLTNSVIANSAGSAKVGFATVNGTDFAGYDNTLGVVAVTTTSVSGILSTASSQNSLLTATGTIGSLDINYNTLKIQAGAGATLNFTGAGIYNRNAILLAGTDDFTIQNTGSGNGGIGGNEDRFLFVSNPSTTLNVAVTLAAANQNLTKSGDGFLALTGSSNQLAFATGTQKIVVAGGVLRGTLTNLGGGTSSGGARTTIQMRGGVLELSGGGTFTRAIGLAGTASGGGLTFDEGAAEKGNGGFSAIGGNATVTLVTAIADSTAATLRWNDNAFLSNGYVLLMGSTKADSRVDLTNAIQLDDGTSGSNYFAREIRVADNTGSANDVARLSGVISGSANADLLKTGDGVLELTNTNTYAGNTLIQQGTLSFSNVGALTSGSGVILSNGTTLIYTGGTASLGTVPLTVTTGIGTVQNSGGSGSTITFGGTITKANTILTFTGSGNFIISGLITGGTTLNFNSDLNVVGTTVTLTNANNDYTGPTNVSGGGTLIDGVTNAIPTGSVATLGSSGDGAVTNTLDLDGFDQALASLNSTSNGDGTNSNRVTNSALGTGTNTLTLSGVNSASAAVSSSFAGILQDGSTARIGLQITGGMHTLSGANSFSGGTTLSGGTLVAGNNSAVGNTGAQAVTFNGGKLASDNDARSLANNIVVNVAGNQITGANSVTLTGTASGPGTLEVALTNAAKSVTVTPASANSFAPDMLRLTSGTLLLGGANKIGDSTAVNFNGGTLNTGGFSDTVGALTLTANSVLDFGTTNNVHLQFSSAAWTAGALTVNNWTGTAFATGNPDRFLVASAGPLDSSFVAQISFTGHGTGAVAYSVGGGLYEIVAVPEPTTVLGAVGLLAFLAYRERRRVRRLWSLHVAPPLILLGFLLVAFVTKDTD